MRYNGCIIFVLLEIDNGGRFKKNYTTNVMTSLFSFSTSLSSVAILHQRVEITFHHLYVILEFVLSTVIVWDAYT